MRASTTPVSASKYSAAGKRTPLPEHGARDYGRVTRAVHYLSGGHVISKRYRRDCGKGGPLGGCRVHNRTKIGVSSRFRDRWIESTRLTDPCRGSASHICVCCEVRADRPPFPVPHSLQGDLVGRAVLFYGMDVSLQADKHEVTDDRERRRAAKLTEDHGAHVVRSQ